MQCALLESDIDGLNTDIHLCNIYMHVADYCRRETTGCREAASALLTAGGSR